MFIISIEVQFSYHRCSRAEIWLLFFSDKPNFCISFILPSSVIYLLLLWWLMSSLEVNGNKGHNHIYKDPQHNSFSEGLQGLFCFSSTILSPTVWLFSLLTLFEFWDKHPSSKNWTKLVFYLVCFKGMLCHHACLLNARSCNVDVPSCWLVWFAQIPFSDCQCLFRSHKWTDLSLNAVNALSDLTEKHQQICFGWKRFQHITLWKQTVGFVERV